MDAHPDPDTTTEQERRLRLCLNCLAENGHSPKWCPEREEDCPFYGKVHVTIPGRRKPLA